VVITQAVSDPSNNAKWRGTFNGMSSEQEASEIIEEEAVFYAGEERIAADLHLPLGEGPHPAVVLCTGFGGVKDLILPDIANRFAAKGLAALRFDHRGFGRSTGTKWRLIPTEQVEDIRSAVTWLSEHPLISADRLGLYGTSFGGANAIVAAALDDRVKVVVTCVAVGNGEAWMRSLRRNWEWIEFQRRVASARAKRVATGQAEWVDSDEIMPPDPESHDWHLKVMEEFPERKYQLPLETAEAILEYRPDELVGRIQPRPVLFMVVEDDLLVPNEQTLDLYRKAGEPKGLLLLKGMRHHDVYSGTGFEMTMDAATAWFIEHFSQGSTDLR
jgi:alpha-beta hydrolase superfamily lysophospholipase